MPVGGNGQKFSRTEEEARFWALLESAWAVCRREARRARQALGARGRSQAAGLSIIEVAVPLVLNALTGLCRGLPDGELASLDRMLERKLYDIDRADIQSVTDGSDGSQIAE